MPTEIVVSLENKPGTLARLGRTLGDAGVNIETLVGFGLDGQFIAHLVPNDLHAALEALRAAGVTVRHTIEVLQATIEDRPGALGAFCDTLAAAGVNVDALYVTGRSAAGVGVIVGVDDLDRAKAII